MLVKRILYSPTWKQDFFERYSNRTKELSNVWGVKIE